MPSGTVLLAFLRSLRVGLLDIDVADHLRHLARKTSLNQPQSETRPAIPTQQTEKHNPTTKTSPPCSQRNIWYQNQKKYYLEFDLKFAGPCAQRRVRQRDPTLLLIN